MNIDSYLTTSFYLNYDHPGVNYFCRGIKEFCTSHRTFYGAGHLAALSGVSPLGLY